MSLPLRWSCRIRYSFCHQLRFRVEHHKRVSIIVPPHGEAASSFELAPMSEFTPAMWSRYAWNSYRNAHSCESSPLRLDYPDRLNTNPMRVTHKLVPKLRIEPETPDSTSGALSTCPSLQRYAIVWACWLSAPVLMVGTKATVLSRYDKDMFSRNQSSPFISLSVKWDEAIKNLTSITLSIRLSLLWVKNVSSWLQAWEGIGRINRTETGIWPISPYQTYSSIYTKRPMTNNSIGSVWELGVVRERLGSSTISGPAVVATTLGCL